MPILNLFPDVPFNHGFIELCEVVTKPEPRPTSSFQHQSLEPPRADSKR